MAQIKSGETLIRELHEILGFNSEEELAKHEARLFPTGNTELENATTSIFLASLAAVKEYREDLFLEIGFNKIRNKNINVHVYTEIKKLNKNGECRPDGLIIVTSGKTNPMIEWAGFVESKVGNNQLDQNQIDMYIDYGKEIGVDNIITISNYMVTTPSSSPFKTKKRNFNLYHWSWTYLKVTAKRLVRAGEIEDSDHEYILKELRRYFDSHTKLSNFTNMGGKEWKDAVQKCRDLDRNAKLPKTCTEVLIDAYKQEEKDIALQLTDRNSKGLHVRLESSKEDRQTILLGQLEKNRSFVTTLVINQNKNWKFDVTVDFVKLEIECRALVAIEKGKAQAQTTALLNMLQNAGHTSKIIINAMYPRNKTPNLDCITLQQLLEEKNSKNTSTYSTVDKSLGEEIKTKDLLGAEFLAPIKFVQRIEDIAERFLEQVMVNVE